MLYGWLSRAFRRLARISLIPNVAVALVSGGPFVAFGQGLQVCEDLNLQAEKELIRTITDLDDVLRGIHPCRDHEIEAIFTKAKEAATEVLGAWDLCYSELIKNVERSAENSINDLKKLPELIAKKTTDVVNVRKELANVGNRLTVNFDSMSLQEGRDILERRRKALVEEIREVEATQKKIETEVEDIKKFIVVQEDLVALYEGMLRRKRNADDGYRSALRSIRRTKDRGCQSFRDHH